MRAHSQLTRQVVTHTRTMRLGTRLGTRPHWQPVPEQLVESLGAGDEEGPSWPARETS